MRATDSTAPRERVDVAALLGEQAWLRSLAHALVGESGADDLAQDVALAALERKPEARNGLRPWLACVARRLALQGRRRSGRRERRERNVARTEATPSAADVVERAQLHRMVVDAALALDAPYRTALLLHFYDGLPVKEVARRCGVPLETARTRLRRGLAMLRARLDRSFGTRAAWTGPLAALAPASIPSATLFAGGLLMTTQTKALIGAIALAVAALLVWDVLPAPAIPPTATHAVLPKALAAVAPERAAEATDAQPKDQALDRAVAPMTNGVHIHGRCVAAENGAPLAGCLVELFDSAPDVETMGSRRADASTSTGPDGRFRLEWPLAEPRHLTLWLRPEQRAQLSRDWPRIGGGDLDCGDVPLALGAVLVGRAHDEQGLPVSGLQLTMIPAVQGTWRQSLVSAWSDRDGVLHQAHVLVDGRWQLKASSDHQLLRPDHLEVPPGPGSLQVDVVVRRPEELPAISGTLVDALGTPVENASICAHRLGGLDLFVFTAKDGSFAFHRKDDVDTPMRFQLLGRHRLLDADRSYAWGTCDLKLVAIGPATARLIVVDAAGAPVERFAARIVAADGNQFLRLCPSEVRKRLHDGALVLRELPPNRYWVTVLPEDAACGCTAPLAWDLQDDAVLRIGLAAPARLRVNLRLADDTQVSGSRVQLLRSEAGSPLQLDCQTVTLAESFAQRRPDSREGVVVAEDTTGGEGAAVVCGPPGETFAVRALGPGHSPLLQPGVVLPPGDSELVLQVARGATIGGTLCPRAVLDLLQPRPEDLRAAAGAGGDLAKWATSRRPVLWLAEIGGQHRRLPFGESLGMPVGDDGTFRFDAVPVGDWQVSLWYWRNIARAGGKLCWLELASVTSLRDGEVRHLDLDVSAALPGHVVGLVLREGQPWRQGRARLGATEVDTDDHGRFVAEVDAGRYWLELLTADSGQTLAYADDAIDVVPGVTVERTFDLRHRVLRLRVLEADGTPASQRLILLRDGLSRDDPKPDAEGWIVVDPVPPRPVEVLTYPKGFDAAARTATKPEVRKSLVIRLGPITVPADQQEARVELRIPPGK